MNNETDFHVRLGQFRKALQEQGLHGHYNLFQQWFGEEADQGDETIEATRRQALVDAARAVCGGCALSKPVVENAPGHWVHREKEGTDPAVDPDALSICMCGTTIQPLIAALDCRRPKTSEERDIDDLVNRFSEALRAKLHQSEQKHGWRGGWKDISWRPTLLYAIRQHLAKGDPRDVAAYCAFAFHHGWSLTDDAGEDFETRAIIAEFLAKAGLLEALRRDSPGEITTEVEEGLREAVEREFDRKAEGAREILSDAGKLPKRNQPAR